MCIYTDVYINEYSHIHIEWLHIDWEDLLPHKLNTLLCCLALTLLAAILAVFSHL